MTTRASAPLDAALQQLQKAQQQARQRELEDERQKNLVVSVQPQAGAAQAHLQPQAKPDDAGTQAIGAASAQKEASRLEDSARRFNAPTPSQVQQAQQVQPLEASQEAVRVAAFARARDPMIKG